MNQEVTCYLIVEAKRASWGGVWGSRIVGMRKRRAGQQPHDGLIVKVTLQIPETAFNEPAIVLEVPAQSGITGTAVSS